MSDKMESTKSIKNKKQKKSKKPSASNKSLVSHQRFKAAPFVLHVCRLLSLQGKHPMDKIRKAFDSGAVSSLGIRLSEEDISFLTAVFFKGTQNPVFRLPLIIQTVAVTDVSDYNTVYTLDASQAFTFTIISQIFAEYRMIDGEIQLFPSRGNFETSAMTVGVAALDYGVNSTPLTTLDDAQSNDSHKWVQTQTQFDRPSPMMVKWPIKLEKIAAQQWISTVVNNIPFVIWKPFIERLFTAGHTTNFTLTGWVDFQFRQYGTL